MKRYLFMKGHICNKYKYIWLSVRFCARSSTVTSRTLDQLISKIQQENITRTQQELISHPLSITMTTNLRTKHHKKPFHNNHHHTSDHQTSHPSNKMYHQGLSHQSNNYTPCTKKCNYLSLPWHTKNECHLVLFYYHKMP